jgi:Domain of unknown function (DUF5122) beta-propeller
MNFSMPLALAALVLSTAGIAQSAKPREQPTPIPTPIAFIPNSGQWQEPSRFVARTAKMVAHFEKHSMVFQLPRGTNPKKPTIDVVRLEFEDARTDVIVSGRKSLAARLNYFMGSSETDWKTGVKAFGELYYSGVWDDVDLRVRDEGGVLEYDVLLAPQASLEQVVIRCDGAQRISLEKDGKLAIHTPGGILRHTAPRSWTVNAAGERKAIDCRFRILDKQRFGFSSTEIPADSSLVIDPGLNWSTFLGGAKYEYLRAAARDSSGDIIVTGYAASTNFPTTAGSYQKSFNGKIDAVISRLSGDGKTLRWSTFLGGSSSDWGLGLALHSSGHITVTGFTTSKNFPVTKGALQTSNKGGFGEAFVTQISKDGTKLNYSTYLGGSGWETPAAIAADAAGNVTVIGVTQSKTDFPTTIGSYDTTHNGSGDGFVARLNPTGTKLIYSTFLGSSGWDPLNAITLDSSGNAFIIADIFGVNNASNFPTTAGAYDRTFNDLSNKSDTIVCKLSADGKKLLWSTWLGGNNWDPGYDIILDSAGNPTICGESWSTNFPVTSNAYQKANQGQGDAYIARLSADGSKLLFSTLMGGKAGEDRAFNIAIDAFDSLVVSGWTFSSDFPTTPGAISRAYKSKADTFVARLDPNASKLYYSTLFNGSGNDHAYAMSMNPHGSVTIAGDTFGRDFRSTTGSFDPTYNGLGDAYVAQLSVLPTGVNRMGTSAPGCGVAAAMGITIRPEVGVGGFALLGAGAPPSTSGLLMVGFAMVTNPIRILGSRIYVDLSKPHVLIGIASNTNGRVTLPISLPASAKGARAFTQFLWLNTTACGGANTLSSSNGIDMTVR